MATLPEINYELVNPATGAIVNQMNLDSIISQYQEADEIARELNRFKAACRDLISSYMVSNGTKTHRVRGKTYQATIVEQDKEPSSSALRQTLNAYPDIAAEYIVPAAYRIDKAKWKKALGTASDDPRFNAMKMLIENAIQTAPEQKPRITKIERL